ncbi:hypothetical protein EXW94_23985 [Enterobacter sp. JMULE2]|uniref:hypothetical protein n=1 Tax=Enterobacter sp. JMULE2 TaxID=2518340 RepID=UPI00157717E8|nr:hypothetical protein [Enterobacter sp. JMULE2]NTZ40678.1 hypothetical protein [Enterobacter sp. JMULE2]
MKKTFLTLLVSLLLVQPALAGKEYNYSEVLKQYEELKPLANRMIVVSRNSVIDAEKAVQSGDYETVLQTRNFLIEDFKELKKLAEPLGGPFDEPFGRCGILPAAADNYALSLIVTALSSGNTDQHIDFFHQQYQDIYEQCKLQYQKPPKDKSDLAIIDVG